MKAYTQYSPVLGAFVILTALVAGCASTVSGEGVLPDSPDAGDKKDNPGIPDASPDADLGPVEKTVTLQAGANTITPENSVACTQSTNGVTDAHRENHYYRSFSLANAAITSNFEITNVNVGIETAEAASGSQPITVLVHTLNGVMTLANLTEVARTTVMVPNQAETILDVPISSTVPADSVFVIEVLTPDGVANSNTFFIGSNTQAETSPSFISSATCNITEITQVSQLGIDGLVMSVVLTVTGVHTSP